MDRINNFLRFCLFMLSFVLGGLHGHANRTLTPVAMYSIASGEMELVALWSFDTHDAHDSSPTCSAIRIDTRNANTINDPFTLRDASAVSGAVNVSVEDELTFFLPGAPLVAGAHVIISDLVTSAVYADGYSDATGVFSVTNIPEGALNITVSHPTHTTFQDSFVLNSGATLNINAFISRLPDDDNDGYSAPLDCNDNDPNINPGAAEICNDGIDNDCDGAVDEVATYYVDVDGDGFGDVAVDSVACSTPAGYVTNNSDLCPTDPLKTAPGSCGCGVVDSPTDTDGDGIPDCIDSCPAVAGQIGSVCDDGDPDTALSQLNASCACVAIPQNGDYQSVASGPWETAATWQVYSGGAFQPAMIAPDSTSGWIRIRQSHTVTVSSTITADQVLVQVGGLLSLSGTMVLHDGPGDDVRVRGSFTLNGFLDGAGTTVVRSGGSFIAASAQLLPGCILNIEAGGTGAKMGSAGSIFYMRGTINNAGTFTMSAGRMEYTSSGPAVFNNLAGGVLNLNGWLLTSQSWWLINVFNAGTINKNNGSVMFTFNGNRWRNLDGGVVNVNSGQLLIGAFGSTVPEVEQRGTFNVATGASLRVSSNLGFRFLGPAINNNGSFPVEGIRFLGSAPQQLNGTGTVSTIIVDNPFGVTLGGTQTMTSTFTLTNGKVTLGNNNLILNASGLVGGSSSSYLLTNGTGSLIRTVSNSATDVFFPVGTASSYLPAMVQLDGASTTDNFRVRAADGVSTAYDANDNPTGSAISSNTLLRSWVVREGTAGGSNATVRLQWNGADEASGFTRSACRVSNNNGSAWDAPADGAASGIEPFTRDRSGITAFGPLTVNSGVAALCPGGPEPGTPCDDNSACTINDVIGTNCLCAGTFADADGDGTCDAEDCAPNDPAIHPGATEICDGLDNNCNGQVDENGCGACTPADIALMASDPSNWQPTQACYNSCSGVPDPVACLAQCYALQGLGLPCATCLVEFQACAATQCAVCNTDPNSAACLLCMQSSGCSAQFSACSGLVDADLDGYYAPFDCDDNNASVNPGAQEGCVIDGIDNDCNGLVDEGILTDADGDGFTACQGDCNDTDATVNPNATEICDGIDNNCNGIIDEGFPAYFIDNDGDGFGDPVIPGACGASNSVPNNTDCDDADPTSYPGAPEICDGIDNDCNGIIDDNLSEDLDNDGFTPCQGDCDDNNPTIHPGATELCDGLDNDCNGFIEATIYADVDGDGFGDAANVLPCGSAGVTNAQDCDDSNAAITLPPSWFPDADGDGYGVYGPAVVSCTQPVGYANNSFDCDDTNALIFPGQGCTECSPADLALLASDPFVTNPSQACYLTCGNTPNQQECLSNCLVNNGLSASCANCIMAYQFCLVANCPICQTEPDSPACLACRQNSGCTAGFTACSGLADADGDGVFTPIDCDDNNAAVYPGATEICDGLDNDCNGQVDEGFPQQYADNDGDGFGGLVLSCDTPGIAVGGDCDDDDPNVFPGSTIGFNCNGCSAADQLTLASVVFVSNGLELSGPWLQPLLQCGTSCESDPDPDACLTNCFSTALSIGSGCGQCLLDYISQVLPLQGGGSCNATCQANALAQFLQCSGLVDQDGDGYFAPFDCNDQNPALHPGALEICDGLDNDCNGITDGSLAFADTDGDGFGDPLVNVDCDDPIAVTNSADCDDNDPTAFPGSTVGPTCSACTAADQLYISQNLQVIGDGISGPYATAVLPCFNACPNDGDPQACLSACVFAETGVSNNCSQCMVDYIATIFLAEFSCDASCRANALADFLSCSGLIDADADGYFHPADCNDQDPAINPGATEICDGIDNDCNGVVDEAGAFRDADGDGFGDLFSPLPCGTPGSVSDNTDCNDSDPTAFPGSTIGEPCPPCTPADQLYIATHQQEIDALLEQAATYCVNNGQGFSLSCILSYVNSTELVSAACMPCIVTRVQCQFQSCGTACLVSPATNCASCTNTFCQANFEACIGLVDADQDGYYSFQDCDDQNPSIYPFAVEYCDELDNDCNGLVDDNVQLFALYVDADNDGFGDDDAPTIMACPTPPGYVLFGGDCNDSNPNVFPFQLDPCDPPNGIDDDCDGSVDNGNDLDADGFGTCDGDCDDDNGDIYPGALEICDGIDNDCDGLIDEGFPQQYADNDGDGYGDLLQPLPCDTPGVANADDCDDSNAAVFPGALELCDGVDNDCNGLVDEGLISCCSDFILEFQSGSTNANAVTYEVLDETGTATVLSGNNPVPANSIGTQTLCLPDGCYQLRVTDAGGDGLAGYVLRETGLNGRRFIDNTGNMSNGVSQISSGGTFCIPMSTDELIWSSCNKLDWVNNKYLVCHANAAVSAEWIPNGANNVQDANSGYEFWIFDPNGSYSYRKFRSHNVSDGYSPATANRAAHMKINNWYNTVLTPLVPQNTLLNVRVRGRVNGNNLAFGPACTMKMDATRAACPLVKLQDDPANPSDYSCGVTRSFGGSNSGANKITALPPQFSPAPYGGGTGVHFQFRFRIPAEGVCIVLPPQTSPTRYLNWNSTVAAPLVCSRTYEVDVRVSKDGGSTWCIGGATNSACSESDPWGIVCSVTIGCGGSGVDGGSSSYVQQGTLTMYPNPNRGDQLMVSINALPTEVEQVAMVLYDLTGKLITSRMLAAQDGRLNTTVDLRGGLDNGLYLVQFRASGSIWSERLVIAH